MSDELTRIFGPAVIGAATAVAVMIVRDLGLKILEEHRLRRRSADQVFRRYLAPLACAVVALMYRFREFLGETRYGYFRPEANASASRFDNYKRVSTYYRVAAVLGWIRAIRRELSYQDLTVHKYKELNDVVRRFEDNLADGQDVEIDGLRGLCGLWGLPVPEDASHVAAKVSLYTTRLVHSRSCEVATELDASAQIELLRAVWQMLANGDAPDSTLEETQEAAVRRLATRQAWLYRDWQAAIGDMVLKALDTNPRAFDVMGFLEFEDAANDDQRKVWVSRIAAIFECLDLEAGNKQFDARPMTLKTAMGLLAEMVLHLAAMRQTKGIIAESTVLDARRILAGLEAA